MEFYEDHLKPYLLEIISPHGVFLEMGDPQNHRFQVSILKLSNDLDDLGVPPMTLEPSIYPLLLSDRQ